MTVGVVAVLAKRYEWHMHMTKEVVGVVAVMTDGIRGCGSDDRWH